MLRTKIVDGTGSKTHVMVDESQALHVIENPFPPGDVGGGMRVFRQHLTDDGLATDGTNQAMDVDGSSTAVDFYLGASETADRYLCVLSFVIADASQSLNEFANSGAALTNGCRLFYTDDQGEVDIHDGLKTNFQFIRLCCTGMPPVGATTNAFLANNVSGASEGYIPFLDMRQTFGFRWGVKISKGSKQRITMRIRDDCTAADQFDAIAYGFERTF